MRFETIKKPTIDWVEIPSGTFLMGSPSQESYRVYNEIQHRVNLESFKISKFTVTFDQYEMFCIANGKEIPDDSGFGRGNHPVINVSWEDAKSFADWMNCRLPTESEWEYSCRAGSLTPFNTGTNLTTSQANFNGNYPNQVIWHKEIYLGRTMPVGSYAPNAWGLFDMHGNVSEWCEDCCDAYCNSVQYGLETSGQKIKRIRRGGGWNDFARRCRSARRDSGDIGFRTNFIGFRLVSGT